MPPFRACRLLLPLLAATPALAAQSRAPTLAERYVRVSAANAAGDFATASAEMTALMQAEPGNTTVLLRAYRQAITGGDRALASRAAKALQAQHALPVDGPLLQAVDALEARDWRGARAAADTLEQGRLFAFFAPFVRAWTAFGAHDADPLPLLDAARGAGLAAGYYPEQHVLLLLALNRDAEAAAELGRLPMPSNRLRVLVAGALARKDRAAAQALIAGDEEPLAAARARIAAGERLPRLETPAAGLGELLARVALDFNRQRLLPVATVMARLASFAAPDNASAWIGVAQVLAVAHQPEAAIAALDHVPERDPFADAARTLRVSLLIDHGDKAQALETILRVTRRRDATAADWGHVGDVYLALERYPEAADAYGKAVALAEPPHSPDLWTFVLQQGNALEQAGDWPHARAALERAYQLAPDQPVVLNHLGYSQLSRRENVADAEKLIVRASTLRPDDPAITDSLGWSRFLLGRPNDAVPLLERASADSPGEPTINEHLGDVYWTLGRRLEARYAWRAALVTADVKDKPRLTAKLDTGLTPTTASP